MNNIDLREKLSGLKLPADGMIRLDSCSVAGDINMMVVSHLAVLDSELTSESCKAPYRNRLLSLISKLE